MISVKALTESTGITSIPSNYTFTHNPNDQAVSDVDPEESIPIIDFSLLTSGTPDQRSEIIYQLGKACQDWGLFLVINHGVPEKLMKEMMEACRGFFNLTEEEKKKFEGKNVLDPISCGTGTSTSTSVNASVDKVLLWRDYLKCFVHPTFHSPNTPAGFSEILLEYSKRIREVANQLLKGISKSLGLEDNYTEKAMNLESGVQLFAANLYPPCPQPELAMGIPPHSDHGLLTLLINNGISGLQVQHKGKWLNVNSIPNAFMANIGDHMEIMNNGKYKSMIHRAVVNCKATRMSIVMAHGPSFDTVVSPALELVDNESHPAKYIGMKYKDYIELQTSKPVGRSCLDCVRI